MADFKLIKPTMQHLPSYKAALERGWGPDTRCPPESGQEDLQKIAEDAEAFINSLDDPEAKAGPVTLPDGSIVPRLPGFNRWMWDGEFCGRIGFRWQRGTTELPPTCLGHIGYSTVEWKQGRGYATKALGLLLPELKDFEGLSFVAITTTPNNIPSQKVILNNGGVLIETFQKLPSQGTGEGLLYRINL